MLSGMGQAAVQMLISVLLLFAGAGCSGAGDGRPGTAETIASAFGVFAGFTREFTPYEQATGLTHAQYLSWAGEQYRALGAHWTRSNLQLIWDQLEPELGQGYDWFNEMGTEECFSAAAAAGVHYLAVFHEGGILDEGLRDPLRRTAEYQRFVRDVVERYDGDGRDDAPGGIRIKHWQVGNETPRIAALPDAARVYADWFEITAAAVRQADPTAALVLIGSTDSSTVDELHQRVIPVLAERGVRFDAVDIHHWGTAGAVEIRAAAGYQSLFAAQGLTGVELWSTENGTWVGEVTRAAADCGAACTPEQVCVAVAGEPRCVPRCASDADCPPSAPSCDVASGICGEPTQSLTEQARSLIRRFVLNRDAGVRRIMWNNLVAWHRFGGNYGGIFDRMGLVSGGFLEFESEADRGRPRPAWFAYQMLAARTDALWAERLGPVETGDARVYASAYRNASSGLVGWVVWAEEEGVAVERRVAGSGARVTGLITDAGGSPLRDETVPAVDGSVAFQVGRDPLWVEPLPE